LLWDAAPKKVTKSIKGIFCRSHGDLFNKKRKKGKRGPEKGKLDYCFQKEKRKKNHFRSRAQGKKMGSRQRRKKRGGKRTDARSPLRKKEEERGTKGVVGHFFRTKEGKGSP